MKKLIIGLVCALVAPLAFAQTGITDAQSRTRTTTTTTTTNAEPSTTDTYTAGTVTTYEPGRTIVVRGDNDEGPVRFAIGKAVRIVDRAGHVVKRALTPRDKVRVYYTGNGDQRVVERVEVED